MDIYLRKKRWKWFLFGAALIIIIVSLYYTNIIVDEIRKDERRNVELWADAIHRKAELVNATNRMFDSIQKEERSRVDLVAEAQRRLIVAGNNEDINFYLDIITNNTTIPVMQVDESGMINSARNVDFSLDSVTPDGNTIMRRIRFEGQLKKEFSAYPPVVANYFGNRKVYFYYKDSRIFSQIRDVINNQVQSFFSDIVLNSASVPVIITDSTRTVLIEYGNIPEKEMSDQKSIQKMIEEMYGSKSYIRVYLPETGVRYILYKDSFLLTQLTYYPYVQFIVIGLFLLIAYLMFSNARRSEQNQVWVGMARETAHQLGTPLSSMVGWVELLKLKGLDDETVLELEKDVNRLETITDRFSKIGSMARLEPTNVVGLIYNTVSYIRSRTSQKVHFNIIPGPDKHIIAPLNIHLFEWVIENLCKNAVDAMDGRGRILIDIKEFEKQVQIDVCDTGKGIPKSRFKAIFRPGYTSKQRGWGLGLTLSKRIVENYHKGRIFVESSTMNKGTTFRIILKK